jgi:hypothetical protein
VVDGQRWEENNGIGGEVTAARRSAEGRGGASERRGGHIQGQISAP